MNDENIKPGGIKTHIQNPFVDAKTSKITTSRVPLSTSPFNIQNTITNALKATGLPPNPNRIQKFPNSKPPKGDFKTKNRKILPARSSGFRRSSSASSLQRLTRTHSNLPDDNCSSDDDVSLSSVSVTSINSVGNFRGGGKSVRSLSQKSDKSKKFSFIQRNRSDKGKAYWAEQQARMKKKRKKKNYNQINK